MEHYDTNTTDTKKSIKISCNTKPAINTNLENDTKSPLQEYHIQKNIREMLQKYHCIEAYKLQKLNNTIVHSGSHGDLIIAPTIPKQHTLLNENVRDEILQISSNETPMNAFRKQINYGVQSAPVFDIDTLKCYGFLDLKDLVSIVTLIEQESISAVPCPLSPQKNSKIQSLRHIDDTASDEINSDIPTTKSQPPFPHSAKNITSPTLKVPRQKQKQLQQQEQKYINNSVSSPKSTTSTIRVAAYQSYVFQQVGTTRVVDHTTSQDYTVTYLAARNRCVMVDIHCDLQKVITILADVQDVNRVLVIENLENNTTISSNTMIYNNGINNNHRIVCMLSQSDIVKVLFQLLQKQRQLILKKNNISINIDDTIIKDNNAIEQDIEQDSTIKSQFIGTSPVISVHKDTNMITALKMMSSKKISGLAIVDDMNRFINHTTSTDLKLYLQSPSINLLHLPVLTFVTRVRDDISIYKLQNTYSDFSSICIDLNSTQFEVITKLACTNSHRVYVLDMETKAPLSIISVEDITHLIHRGYSHDSLNIDLQRSEKSKVSILSQVVCSSYISLL